MNGIERLVLLGLVLWPASASADRFEDTRPLPPERWTDWQEVGLDVRLGGTLLMGNVEHWALSAELGFSWRFLEDHGVFLSGEGRYAEFGGTPKIDHTSGSLLYAWGFHKNFNLYAYTTHYRSRFLKLDYRMTNSLGLCLHSFAPKVFDPLLISVGVTPEYEIFDDGSDELTWRVTARLSFDIIINDYMSFGIDGFYQPAPADPADYRVYGGAWIELKVTEKVLAFRLAAADEYDSDPRPGVQSNDLTLIGSIVARIGK